MNSLTVAVCTYNRAHRLPGLVKALREQECPISFEILIVDNNSTDETQTVLDQLSLEDGSPLWFVKETKQGIVHARNRAIEESMGSAYMAFLDDDELPSPGMLKAAVDALEREGAECVGGRVKVCFDEVQRPSWLGDELLGFLAEVDYGDEPLWISDPSLKIWTCNVAYRTSVFGGGLRFDLRYDRAGKGPYSGEDEVMFDELFKRGARIRYRPDMMVEHFIEDWKLKRSYFLKRHFLSGKNKGLWELGEYPRTICGVPPFMLVRMIQHWWKTLKMFLSNNPKTLRQAMTAMHAMGMIAGTFQRCRDKKV